ncbi:UNVERIFIED_CONTAM: hypothetical protein RMT77_008357 [Armadillidium vulgare]
MNTLISKYPRLMPLWTSDTPCQLEGFITVCGKDYYINLVAPFFPSASCIRTSYDIQLQEILSTENLKLYDNCSVLEYVDKLVDICEKRISNDLQHFAHIFNEDKHEKYKFLLSDIEKLGWEKIFHISSDFSSLQLLCRDKASREHRLLITVPADYPKEDFTVFGDLPVEVDFSTKRSLCDLYKMWEEELMAYQLLWNILDCLDETAFVLDPEKPMKKHLMRRIILENQVSVHLTFSPVHPLDPPKCQLLGPSSLVMPLNDKLITLYQVWDSSRSVVDNIEHTLKVSVIKKGSKELSNDFSLLVDVNVECAVCYSLRLEDQLPDFTCDHCQKNFHPSCLYEWLRYLPSSRQNAQYIRGDCPFCTKIKGYSSRFCLFP